MKKRIYIWDNIQKKLSLKGVERYEVDVRYLDRWIKQYPDCFPKCMLKGNFTAVFNPDKYRWEIWSGKHNIKFDIRNYLR